MHLVSLPFTRLSGLACCRRCCLESFLINDLLLEHNHLATGYTEYMYDDVIDRVIKAA